MAVEQSILSPPPTPAPARKQKVRRTPEAIDRTPLPFAASDDQQPGKTKAENAVTMQLSKTKMCAFFKRGKCASSFCRYAHSVEELRTPPNLHKTKLCIAFLQGGCSSENCPYAHGETDLRVTEGIYKSQMCNFFERGYCKKGDRCNHAHGNTDLRVSTPSTTASTPTSKTLSFNGGGLALPQKSPLPLLELLADSQVNPFGMAASPSRSVAELASLAFSPMATSPSWGQCGTHPFSPVSAFGSSGNFASAWPREPIDVLMEQHHMIAQTNLLHAMNSMVVPPEQFVNQPDTWASDPLQMQPQKVSTEHLVDWSPSVQSPEFEPLSRDLSKQLTNIHTESEPFSRDLSKQLANIDAVVRDLAADIANLQIDGQKGLHRI